MNPMVSQVMTSQVMTSPVMDSPVTTSRLWIQGHTRSGKTTRLVQEFGQWLEATPAARSQTTQAIVLAATSDTQLSLQEALLSATDYSCNPYLASPLGFIRREVLLFWPLLAQRLNLSTLFPLTPLS